MAAKKNPARVPQPPDDDLRDRIESAMRAVFATVGSLIPQPWGIVLAAAAGYLAPLFPSFAQRRTQAWGAELAKAANELRRRDVLVEELAEDEPFTDVVLAATEIAMRTHSNKKRERLRNALINAGLHDDPSGERERERVFLRLVDEFGELHVDLLTFLDDPAAAFEKRGEPLQPIANLGHGVVGAMDDLTNKYFSSYGDEGVFRLAIEELQRRGLAAFNPNVICHAGHGQTTALGKSFLAFIGEPPPA